MEYSGFLCAGYRSFSLFGCILRCPVFSCGSKTDQFYWDFLVCKSFLLYHTNQVHLSHSSRRLIPRQFLITNLVIQLKYVFVLCSAAPKQSWHNITWNMLLIVPPKTSRSSFTNYIRSVQDTSFDSHAACLRIRQGVRLWHCCEVREKTNKMQQLDIYYQHFLNMFRASLCPSSGEKDVCYCTWCTALVLLDVVGSGCGALRCRVRALSPEDGHNDARNMLRKCW